MSRPRDLPDYGKPPLKEVALGVQFSPPIGYQQIYAKDVWDLFKDEFPKISTEEALPPVFETFGLSAAAQSSLKLKPGPFHDRFWFLTDQEDELIQFQEDRVLHNWRKVKDGNNPYPRFETILPKFEAELRKLQQFYQTNFSSGSLEINQCELTYVNYVSLDDVSQLDKWLHVGLTNIEGFEDVSFNFRQQLKRDGEPYGRLTFVCNSVRDRFGAPGIDIRITVRGAPESNSIDSSMRFLQDGRCSIVKCFDSVSTEYAHSKWGKI